MLLLNSYAKLNLYLEVLELRKDSYHNLNTLFERIDLCDKIILGSRQDKKINLICNSPDVPCDNNNLAYRSAKLLQDKFTLHKGVDIKIIKRIPVGAGLGGGSSNAATVLLGLNRLWRLKLSQRQLLNFARVIGSDVAFFIYNCPFAWGSGQGDRIKPLKSLKRLRLWHILVVPKIKVSTPFIYKKWDEFLKGKKTPHLWTHSRINKKTEYFKGAGLTRPKYNAKILNLKNRQLFKIYEKLFFNTNSHESKAEFSRIYSCKLDKNSCGFVPKRLFQRPLFNSLEIITIKLYPQVRQVKDKLRDMGVKSILMSGSGPAVFGIVSSRKEAVSLKAQLKEDSRSWQVFVTGTI